MPSTGRRGGVRTLAVEKEGCAERIARVGTLSQNGYGESYVAQKRANPVSPVQAWGFQALEFQASELEAVGTDFSLRKSRLLLKWVHFEK